jgi:hypothetical protein
MLAVMTGTPEENQPQKSFWSSFTAADMRGLIVGVIGGLLVVMIVALALIVNRHLGSIRTSAAFYFLIVGGVGFLTLLSVVVKPSTKMVGWLSKPIRLILGVVVTLIVVLGLLLFLGEAAGIK